MTGENSRPRDRDAPDGGRHTSGMRARLWEVAYHFHEPADYDIPELPAWTVSRTERNGVALAEGPDAEPFIRADQPTRVRR